MKPEPLTKDKIKIVLSKEADKDLDKMISDFIKDFGFKEDQKKVLKDLLIGIFLMHKQKEKEKVEWLLKEIEKETNKYLDTYSHPDDEALRRILEAFSISITEKIKEAFSGVIE